jgi:hypothetical protein
LTYQIAHTWIFACPQAKDINISSINKINNMTTQLKTYVSSKALFSTCINHNFKHFSWTYSTQQQVSSECVCSPAFSCSCVRDIMRKQVLTSTLNQPRKVLSSFHIREVGILLIIWHLYTFGELQNRFHTFRNKTKQKFKIQGSSKHYDTWHFIDSPNTWVKHWPQWFEK